MLGRGGGGGSSSRVEAAHAHQSAPLSSLTDPSTFAPPPKRLDYGASPVASRPPPSSASAAPTGSARQRLQEREEAQRRADEEANRPPPGPYRPDTTGLSTAHLPKPPAFRPGSGPPAPSTASKPNLPPGHSRDTFGRDAEPGCIEPARTSWCFCAWLWSRAQWTSSTTCPSDKHTACTASSKFCFSGHVGSRTASNNGAWIATERTTG
jgi:hypothetical protein